MELQFYGANCIKLSTKRVNLVIDDNLASFGLKPVATAKDIVLTTSKQIELPAESYFGVDTAGEYEVSDISIQGIPAASHIDNPDSKELGAIMYRIIIGSLRIAVVGHIFPKLTETQLEELGTIDILFVPVGGNGFTLDGVGAQKVVKDIEPRIVIPTHYEDAKFNFEVPQTPLEDAIKGLAMEPAETLDSLKLKNLDLGEGTKLVILNRQ